MARFIISILILAYASSNLAGAVEALAYSGESQHIAHELHDTVHDSAWDHTQGHDQQLEDKAHHHCMHNLVGMAFESPTAHRADAITLLSEGSPSPRYFELRQRLLRPPRN